MNRLGYLRAFAKSWQHGVLALLTLALPFAAAPDNGVALIAGATAYVLGWVFLGDSAWFRRKVDATQLARVAQEETATLARLQAEREALLARLPAEARRRYAALAEVCHDVEQQLARDEAGAESNERLDGLMWTFLGLLGNEANLATFIDKERDESFEKRIAAMEAEVRELEGEVAALEPGGRDYDTRMQLISSRQEGLESLRRRHEQFLRAGQNLELVRAEQERIAEQLKLLRADLYASKSVGQIRQRVSDTIDQLASSGRVSAEVPPAIRELPSFKTRRLGYDVRSES